MFRLSAFKPFHTRIAPSTVGASRGIAGGRCVHQSSSSVLQLSLLMSPVSHMHNNDPEVCGIQHFPGRTMSKSYRQIIEKELKREKKHDDTLMKHAPGWSEVMASVSEANIKVSFP